MERGLEVKHGMMASIESVHAVLPERQSVKSFSGLPPSFTTLGRLCQDLDDVAGSFEMYHQCRQAWKTPVCPEIRSSSYIGALLSFEGSNTGGAPGVQKGTKGVSRYSTRLFELLASSISIYDPSRPQRIIVDFSPLSSPSHRTRSSPH